MRSFCKRIYILFSILFSGLCTEAQNLVPNPGFEQYQLCPNPMSVHQMFNGTSYCNDWVSFIGAYEFNACDSSNTLLNVGVPDNRFGYRYAHNGNGYAGIVIQTGQDSLVNVGVDQHQTADYIQVQLKEVLEANQWYCVSFYVSPAYFWNRVWNSSIMRSAVIDQLGAYFSDTIPDESNSPTVVMPNGYWAVEPQVESRKGWILDDTSTNWTPITGVFKAQGGEKWLSIGCFRPESQLNKKLIFNPYNIEPENTTAGNPFYYIDDVNVNKISIGNNAGYVNKNQDTIICNGDTTLTLYAPPGADSYEWSTGATTQSITSQPGLQMYWYKANYIGCGIVSDTITIRYRQIPLDLGNDTSLCYGNTLNISPQDNSGYQTYQWNTGAQTSNIQVIQTGAYILTTTDICGSQTDSINVLFNALPATLSLDTIICQFSDISKLSIEGVDIKWYATLESGTAIDLPPISTLDTGTFTVYATQTINDCESERGKMIFSVIAAPSITLAADTIFCPEYVPLIGVDPIKGEQYLWNTNETKALIKPEGSGVFILSISNLCGSVTDSINVLFDECLDCAWIPNSFTPNDDGVNDNFAVELKCPVESFKLLIYNRWGQKVFESYRPNTRWNGFQELSGTYFYNLQYRNVNNHKIIYKKGDITLFR